MFKTIAARYLRGFVAGGLANLVAILAANQFNIHSLAELKAFGLSIGMGFIVGGILALDKLIRYVPEGTPQS